jgi:hypothetical protein
MINIEFVEILLIKEEVFYNIVYFKNTGHTIELVLHEAVCMHLIIDAGLNILEDSEGHEVLRYSEFEVIDMLPMLNDSDWEAVAEHIEKVKKQTRWKNILKPI